MKYAIVYCSHTGNTKYLAEVISRVFSSEELVYCGVPNIEKVKEADVVFVGFWTDKGSCPSSLLDFFAQLHHKQVVLFGTCGFGGSEEYFNTILQRVSALIEDDCTYVDGFMCQGKMPIEVRERYVMRMAEAPEKMKQMIENFDQASSHPDENDVRSIVAFTQIVKHSVE